MGVFVREAGVELGSVAPQLFLSHSSDDESFVTRLAQDLNRCEVDVWLDTWELRPGVDLHERISDAIHKSKFVAVTLSQKFSNSKWTKGEVNQALTREKAEGRDIVLPLLIESGVDVPPSLQAKKFLDFTEGMYFPSLVHLAGMIHELPLAQLEAGIKEIEPGRTSDCIDVLRYCGFEPYCVVDKQTLFEIAKLGGHRHGDRVRFNPREISRRGPSPGLRALMRRLAE